MSMIWSHVSLGSVGNAVVVEIYRYEEVSSVGERDYFDG